MRSIDAVWEKSELIYIDKKGKDLLLVIEENGQETWFCYDQSQIASKHIIDEKISNFLISYFRDGNIRLQKLLDPELPFTEVQQNIVILKLKDGKLLDGPSYISFFNDIVISVSIIENNNPVKTISCFKHGKIKVGSYNEKTLIGQYIDHLKGGTFYACYAAELAAIGPNFA